MAKHDTPWYMRDNHTFVRLPETWEDAFPILQEELAGQFSHGMLCTKASWMDDVKSIHAHGFKELSTFLKEAQIWYTLFTSRKPQKQKEVQMEEEVLAIMKDVGIGMRDHCNPILWFNAYTDESSASLQIVEWEEAGLMIEAYGVHDALQLEGKPIWMKTDGSICRRSKFWTGK